MIEVQGRELLIGEILRALESRKVYIAQIEIRPLQRVVDIRWAMKMAGRRLGQPVHIDEERSGERLTLVATTAR